MEGERYEVQTRLTHVGAEGRRRLAESRVLVVGVGGLGCASSTYLTLAGIGSLRIVDGDTVATSNLGRQALYRDGDVGRPKAVVAAGRLREMNPEVHVEAVEGYADRANLAALLEGIDLVIDGSDGLGTRRLLNRAFVTLGIPVVFGAATGFHASVLTCLGKGPCYECVWREPPADACEEAGVLGPLVGMVGAAQAAEGLRALWGLGDPGRLLLIDATRPEWRTVRVQRRADCAICNGTGL